MTDFYEGKHIVVTGGRGFVGSHLVDMLQQRGASVLVLDNGARGKNHNPLVRYADPRQADVTRRGVGAWFVTADVVFNLAGHVGGLYHNIAHQAEQFWGNMQTSAVPALEAAQESVPVYLQVSTVCCYASGYNNPAQEENGHLLEPERGNAGYAWAKRMGERVCEWAFEKAPTRYVIVRPTNIYGPRDYFDATAHVIPALIRKFSTQDEVDVFGGSQMREFIYVEDVARGMLQVAESGARGEVYNLGTAGATMVSIRVLAETIQRLMNHQGHISFVPDMPTGDEARSTDCEKAWTLGWEHQVSLEEGLRKTIRWWQEQSS